MAYSISLLFENGSYNPCFNPFENFRLTRSAGGLKISACLRSIRPSLLKFTGGRASKPPGNFHRAPFLRYFLGEQKVAMGLGQSPISQEADIKEKRHKRLLKFEFVWQSLI
jgi:hypothetical protein